MSEPTEKRRYSLFSKSLKSCVEPVVRPSLKAQGVAASKIIVEWEQIVGKELAAYTMPVKLTFPRDKNSEGTLTVACEGAYSLTLQHIQPVIMERIASYFGYRAVARINIEQRKISKAPPKRTAKVLKPRVVNTSGLEDVTDPELKEALSGLAKTLSGNTMPTEKPKE